MIVKFRAFVGNKIKGHIEAMRLMYNISDGSKSWSEFVATQFTGFKDNKGVDIYEGDILSDWNEVDGKMVQSKMQVFWCVKTGA